MRLSEYEERNNNSLSRWERGSVRAGVAAFTADTAWRDICSTTHTCLRYAEGGVAGTYPVRTDELIDSALLDTKGSFSTPVFDGEELGYLE